MLPINQEERPSRLQGDCERCFGLCCVSLPFAKSVDFAMDKDAGQPCANLRPDFRCGIHTELRDRGFRGCTVYDCFGAGQYMSQVTYGGRDWRQASTENAAEMFQAFPVMHQLFELLAYLQEVLALPEAGPVHGAARSLLEETERLTRLAPEGLLRLDIATHRGAVGTLLLQASELSRAEAGRRFDAEAREVARGASSGSAGGRDGRSSSGAGDRSAAGAGSESAGSSMSGRGNSSDGRRQRCR
ncbi:pentapeptide repeat-containing protein [Paenibacillus koleovorans]|uniref:pentapeptide repeat-containing protein n=1 Tax=Paenibacillus koleovorans TaxID=121608 RepID=UPI000FD8C798|nr:pentapeptide repeat-containing protein [Paenibacillus koleovorans]